MLERLKELIENIRYSRYGLLILSISLLVLASGIFIFAYCTRKPLPAASDKIRVVSGKCADLSHEINALRTELEKAVKPGDVFYNEAQSATAKRLLAAYDSWLGECANGVKEDGFFDSVRVNYESTSVHADAVKLSDAEQAGKIAMSKGDYGAARRYFSIAVSIQKRINDDFPSARQADVNRRVALELALLDATYKPVLARYSELNTDAEIAYGKSDYEKARSLYLAQLDEMARLESVVPGTYLDFNEPKRSAERRVMECSAQIRGRELPPILSAISDAVKKRDWTSADAGYLKATDLLNSIARDFPQSVLASPERRAQLEQARQNDLALAFSDRIGILLGNLHIAISTDDPVAVQDVTNLAKSTLDDLGEKFPHSSALHAANVVQLQYLVAHRGDLIEVRGSVVPHLLPIPAKSEWRLLDREVWQGLYIRLMDRNPSARKADALPVEGITMSEAREFAERLSWILGSEVCIPDTSIYLELMKGQEPAYVRKYAWSSVTAPNRETQPVATSTPDARGYFDLYGNASEWAERQEITSSTVNVIGGSVRDNPSRLLEIPKESHPVDERVRNAGFRVMVRSIR